MGQVNRTMDRLNRFIQTIESQVYPEATTQLHEKITLEALQRWRERYEFPRHGLILDIGCGQGPALRHFDNWGMRAVGITLSDEDISACKSQGFTVAKMDQSFLDFEDSLFDLVWARHVIEHSIFPLFTLAEYFRVMKPGGVLYVEVPAPETDCHHERNPNHYSMFSKQVWHQLLLRSGFVIEEETRYSFVVLNGNDEYWGYYCRKPFANTSGAAGGSPHA